MNFKPRYKNTVVCKYCRAEYNPNLEWIKGFDISQGTQPMKLASTWKVPKNTCPLCGRKRSNEN